MKPRALYWLPTDTLPPRFRHVWIDTTGALHIGYRWRVVWLVLWQIVAEVLAVLAAWVTCELAHGRGWRRERQLELWRIAA